MPMVRPKVKKEESIDDYEDYPEDDYDSYNDLPQQNQRVTMTGKFDGRIIINNGHIEFDGKFDGEIETGDESILSYHMAVIKTPGSPAALAFLSREANTSLQRSTPPI